ncbi:MAG: HNH endonuclease [Oligoflexia bacterium]|nr:HNH endonuclease [Oligoflexia bacterium]
MLFMGKVEIVEEYDRELRSISLVIKAPAVVRLLRFIKLGRKSPPLCRSNILARDSFQCQYCEKILSSREATLDHVLPRSQGGKTTWENIVCSCAGCNRKKGGRTPEQAGMRLMTKPARPDWLPVLNLRFNGNVPQSWQTFLAMRY